MDLKGAQVYYLGDIQNYDSFFQTIRINTVLDNEDMDSDDEDEEPTNSKGNNSSSNDNSGNGSNGAGGDQSKIQRKIENNAYKYKFCVIAADRELFMAAPSMQDAKDWVKRVRACIFVEDYFVDCKICGVERPLLSIVMLLTAVAAIDTNSEEEKKQSPIASESDIETLVLQNEDPFTISDLKALTTTCIQSTRVSLKSLSIVNCNVGDEHLKLLAHGLADNQTVTSLDMSYNLISDFGICDLIDGLFINITLKRLTLSHNNIGDVGCVYLSDLLLGNVSLKKIDISYNRVGSDGAKSLSKALCSNSLLKILDLGCNNIGDEGCSALAEGLKVNKTLQTLDLSFNSIGSDGLIRLCNDGIIYNRGLKDLSLHGNPFDNAGAKSLVKALIDHKTLKRVDIGNNEKIGVDGIGTIAQTLTTKYMVGNLVMRRKGIAE